MNSTDASNRRTDTIANLFGIDLRTLALFRVAVASVLLFNLAVRSFDIASLLTEDGAAPIETVRQFYGDTWIHSLYFLDGSFGFQVALFAISVLFVAALLIGFHTRMATIGSWILFVSLNNRVPSINTGGDVLLSMALFWGMFLPLGAKWSMDAERGRMQTANDRELSIATLAVLLQIFWMYWSTGLWKLNELWLGGRALGIAFTDDMLTRPAGQALLAYPGLLTALTYSVLAIELVAPFLLFCPWRTNLVRSVAIAVLVGMHIGIELTMTVLIFSYASLAALTLFVPSVWWDCRPLAQVAGWLDQKLANTAHGKGTRSPLRSESSQPVSARILWSVQLFLLIYIPVFNMLSPLGPRGATPAHRAFNRIGELIGAAQVWKMFDSPPGEHRFVARATFVEGSAAIDILRDEPVPNQPPRPTTRMQLSTARWMLFVRHTATDSFQIFRPTLARYYARRWNERVGPDRQIRELELYFYTSPHESEEAAANGRLLVRVDVAE
jgi:hypothetical protein